MISIPASPSIVTMAVDGFSMSENIRSKGDTDRTTNSIINVSVFSTIPSSTIESRKQFILIWSSIWSLIPPSVVILTKSLTSENIQKPCTNKQSPIKGVRDPPTLFYFAVLRIVSQKLQILEIQCWNKC